MMHRPAGLALLLASFTLSLPLHAQLPPTPEARRSAVEQGLERAVQVAGRTAEPRTIADRMRETGVPAVSVAVIHEGRIDWAMAWGVADVESGRAATTATLFQAASMSKPVAALGALTLVDAGQLALDRDVNEVLRSWQVPANASTAEKPVTLRRLLSHTAGTTVHGFRGYAPGEAVPTPIQVLDGEAPANSAPVRVDTVPGSRWRYSGGGFTIAQQLVEDHTGVPFAEFMRQRVLVPLGMRASTYQQPLPDSLRARAATGYRANGESVTGRYHTYPELAAAGLWTTPSDYALFALGLGRALRGDSGAIVSRMMMDTMLAPVQGGFGIGIGVAGTGEQLQVSHGGSNEGFRSNFIAFPNRGDGVIVMANSDSGAGLTQEIVLAVARVYGWPAPRPRVIVPVPVAPERLAEFVGTYQLQGFTLVITRQDDRLLVSEDGAAPVELVPTGGDAFVHLGGGMLVRFERDATGAVAGVRGGTTLVPRVGR